MSNLVFRLSIRRYTNARKILENSYKFNPLSSPTLGLLWTFLELVNRNRTQNTLAITILTMKPNAKNIFKKCIKVFFRFKQEQQISCLVQTSFCLFLHFGKVKFLLKSENLFKPKNYCIKLFELFKSKED